MKSFIVNATVESTKFNQKFEVEFYCVITEDMVAPQDLKDRIGIGGGVMFVLGSAGSWDQDFDFETDRAIWKTTFNGLPFTLEIPVSSIIGITNKSDVTIQFPMSEEKPIESVEDERLVKALPETNAQKEPVKLKTENKDCDYLKLVSDNTEYEKTESRANLMLVEDNSDEDQEKTS